MMSFRETFLSRSAILVYLSMALSLVARLGTGAWRQELTAMSGTALTLAAIVLFLDMRPRSERVAGWRNKL